jgi:hypothetical protein
MGERVFVSTPVKMRCRAAPNAAAIPAAANAAAIPAATNAAAIPGDHVRCQPSEADGMSRFPKGIASVT